MDGKHMSLSLIYFQQTLEMETKVFHFLLLNLEYVGLNQMLLPPVALCNQQRNFNGLTDVPN